MFGLQSTDQRMDFCWPEKTDYNVFSRYPNFELESIIMKGQPGRHLQGIGLSFTNGLSTPLFERQSYSNALT